MGRVVEIREPVRHLDLDDLSIAEGCPYVLTDPFAYDCLDESHRIQAVVVAVVPRDLLVVHPPPRRPAGLLRRSFSSLVSGSGSASSSSANNATRSV